MLLTITISGGEEMSRSTHDFRGSRRSRYTHWREIKYDRSPKSMGLLQGVSKTIQEEAGQIFYGPKNHSVLPTGLYSYSETSGHRYVYNDTSPDLPPFKSVSYTFDMRDVPLDHWALREQMDETEVEEPETGNYFKENTSHSLDAIYTTHELGQKYLMDVWKKKGAT